MTLLALENLQAGYREGAETKRIVDGVSLTVGRGETLGLVGESGCGKSTLGKAILRLAPVLAGTIRFDGTDITSLSRSEMRPYRARLQMIFQDNGSALNPRHRIGRIMAMPLKVQGIARAERERRVASIIEDVGLDPPSLTRFPHEFSGGQRQRIGIARALVLRPEVVICDEPVSALDVSVQAQILNLLVTLKRTHGLSYIFVSHDLGVVRYFADRVAVMYAGRIVEICDHSQIWSGHLHPYTHLLVGAVPGRHGPSAPIAPPRTASGSTVTAGCRFVTRCPAASELCRQREPVLREVAARHAVACHAV